MSSAGKHIRLQLDAKEAFGAYSVLKKNTKDEELLYIKYDLLCRSLELAFKSILVSKYLFTYLDLKNKYGHNLKKLQEDIVKSPDIDINENESIIIKILNVYYKNREFMYPLNGFKRYPALSDVEPLCERFIDS